MAGAEAVKKPLCFLIPPKISGVVYGPFATSHHGNTLGINFLGEGQKVCNLDCVYCDLGPTQVRLNRIKHDIPLPSLETVKESLITAFKEIHANGPKIDTICLAGNGEPTLHPAFVELVAILIEARDLWLPNKKIIIQSSGSQLETRKIAEAMNRLDERLIKFDAGNEATFKAINSPFSRTSLAKVISGTRHLKDFILQSMFVRGRVNNTGQTDLDDWIEVIAMIKPKGVQILGMTFAPARDGVHGCDEDTLYTIASHLERKTKIRAVVITEP